MAGLGSPLRLHQQLLNRTDLKAATGRAAPWTGASSDWLRIWPGPGVAALMQIAFGSWLIEATLREYERIQDPEDLQQWLRDGLLIELQALPGFMAYDFVDVGEVGDRIIALTVFEQGSRPGFQST